MRGGDRDHIGSLEKGLAVIAAFSASHPRLTLAQAARKTGLTRATVRRHLLTLEALGFAESDEQHYWLTPRVLRLGYAYLSSTPLPKIAQPILDEIGERTKEVASLAILDGAEVVFLGHSSTRRFVAASTSVGLRLPAYCTALGRAILAHRPEADVERLLANVELRRFTPHTKIAPDEIRAAIAQARSLGYSVSDEELEIGLRSIAIPVANSRSQVQLGLAVSLHAAHMTGDEMIRDILPELRAGRAILETMI